MSKKATILFFGIAYLLTIGLTIVALLRVSKKADGRLVRPAPTASPTSVLTPTTSSLSPTPSPMPSPTLSPVPIVKVFKKEVGIAASGGLPGFGQAELLEYFEDLKQLGVGWVRWDFEWSSIQWSGKDSYDWADSDRVVGLANKSGFKILGVIAYAPEWAQASDCRGGFACAPADPIAFGKFAGEVARRYSAKGVHSWEIWNEPNIVGFWRPRPSVEAYGRILKSAYIQIKRADPEAVVLTGGLAATADEGVNIAPITFIRHLYELGGGENFDGIALHPYSFPALPSFPAGWNFWQQMRVIRQLMVTNGDESKPLWITEYGAPTGGPGRSRETINLFGFDHGRDFMSEAAQARLAKDALNLYFKIKEPMGPFFWYSLKDEGLNQETPENFFGLVRFDGSRKPAYDVFKAGIGE